ncbi:hypothetical protein PFICI_03576 [Pestalotiopsis fici W106-1]|uniref:FAD/NAD(P)-binding domain-containing protein n=1 Tax=Pestalotiopsis fici (strain W106-1 / CGMCC3.15140) TaxID=1229662 RepID=W3XJX2_PESFW|nr:uncharacterized protein PFICI_03576 [Pestalotiopsis fici W106-1]ETS85551.1 hypothetical protein PFICI_03576 [Pestalotiopsis fici W106-1]
MDLTKYQPASGSGKHEKVLERDPELESNNERTGDEDESIVPRWDQGYRKQSLASIVWLCICVTLIVVSIIAWGASLWLTHLATVELKKAGALSPHSDHTANGPEITGLKTTNSNHESLNTMFIPGGQLHVAGYGLGGLFQHDLISINGNTAIFNHLGSGDQTNINFDFLYAVPKMGPHAFIKDSPLSNEAGLVDVDDSTTQHKKYGNVWSAGDASSLPTSKTTAAITSQAPILISNLLAAVDGEGPQKTYDGYTSCSLVTEYGKVLLAEFKYGGVPKETFAMIPASIKPSHAALSIILRRTFPSGYTTSLWSKARGLGRVVGLLGKYKRQAKTCWAIKGREET